MQRRDLDEIIDKNVKPIARTYAEGLHEQISVAMVAGMDEAVAEDIDPYLTDNADIRDLVLPALKSEVYWHLARLANQAANGWAEVVERNLD